MSTHLFPEVRLFIIFGCALGPSDGWWWRRIVESLDQGVVDEAAASELIIYWWKDGNSVERSDDIIDRFFAGAGVGARDAVRRRVQGQIHVVTYTDDTPPVWLATP